MNFHFFNWPHAAFPFSCMQWNGHSTMYPNIEWEQGLYDPGAFKLDHQESTEPILHKWISTFLIDHMQHFPFPACVEKGTPIMNLVFQAAFLSQWKYGIISLRGKQWERYFAFSHIWWLWISLNKAKQSNRRCKSRQCLLDGAGATMGAVKLEFLVISYS